MLTFKWYVKLQTCHQSKLWWKFDPPISCYMVKNICRCLLYFYREGYILIRNKLNSCWFYHCLTIMTHFEREGYTFRDVLYANPNSHDVESSSFSTFLKFGIYLKLLLMTNYGINFVLVSWPWPAEPAMPFSGIFPCRPVLWSNLCCYKKAQNTSHIYGPSHPGPSVPVTTRFWIHIWLWPIMNMHDYPCMTHGWPVLWPMIYGCPLNTNDEHDPHDHARFTLSRFSHGS